MYRRYWNLYKLSRSQFHSLFRETNRCGIFRKKFKTVYSENRLGRENSCSALGQILTPLGNRSKLLLYPFSTHIHMPTHPHITYCHSHKFVTFTPSTFCQPQSPFGRKNSGGPKLIFFDFIPIIDWLVLLITGCIFSIFLLYK